ncbi:MAG: helix-turn-helix domain-containing protein [Ardenticatenia bacterium]|nr:helix-turn-helix domain-containing protein [Ardenticatenia bacterium]
MELAKLQAVTEARQAIQADLLDVILANEEEPVIRARARTLGYELNALHLVLVAEAPGHDVGHLSLWGRRVADLTARRGWWALTMPRDRRLVIFIGTRGEHFAGLGAWLDEIKSAWSGGPLTLGVGEPARDLSGLRQSLAQAEDARELGTRLFGHGRVYRYGDLGLYQLFRHLQGHPDVIAFYRRTLGPLVAYDTQHGTNLVKTLDVLLAKGGNVSRAAQELHVHRNSLIYRVERIREICGLDPLAPDDAFALRLALLLRPLADRSR